MKAWGVRHITLLDYGRVALSNPLRQSLFTHEDSLNNGKLKAEAAAENLKRIFPGVVVDQTLSLFCWHFHGPVVSYDHCEQMRRSYAFSSWIPACTRISWFHLVRVPFHEICQLFEGVPFYLRDYSACEGAAKA